MKAAKFLLITMLFFGAYACKPDPSNPPTNEPEPAPQKCAHKGKIERALCGFGVWGDYWIRLNDGTLLQPCMTDVDVPIALLYDGREVEVGYEKVAESNSCQSTEINCKAYPGRHTNAYIKCLNLLGKDNPYEEKPTGNTQCNEEGELLDYMKKGGCDWIVKLNSGKVVTIKYHQIEGRGFKNGDKIRIGYTLSNEYSNCSEGNLVEVKCIEKVSDGDGQNTGKCTHVGTLRKGIRYGCDWNIELENSGGLLAVENKDIDGSGYGDGDLVRIGFEETNGSKACSEGKPVHLVCIQTANSTGQ